MGWGDWVGRILGTGVGWGGVGTGAGLALDYLESDLAMLAGAADPRDLDGSVVPASTSYCGCKASVTYQNCL